MIIDLSKMVEVEEVSDLCCFGKKIDVSQNYTVELTFSKEALVGFATNLIWWYEEIDNPEWETHLHIDPLGGVVPACQTLGFFLTSRSPSLVVCLNGIEQKYGKTKEWEKCKQIDIRSRGYEFIDIKEPLKCDESMEEYELGLRNIVDMKILDKNGKMIDGCFDVVLRLTYGTLKKFATMLLVLANNYSSGKKYLLANLHQEELQYNMGLIFTKESSDVVIKCGDLGCVYDYDPRFGVC